MSGKHAKPNPEGKLRALILGIIWAISTALVISETLFLGIVFGIISLLYLFSWAYEFND